MTLDAFIVISPNVILYWLFKLLSPLSSTQTITKIHPESLVSLDIFD